MLQWLDRRFVFVVGKGGVGKTTTSAAIALAAAREGKRVLIAMCNAKERLSPLLEVDSIGPRNQNILPGIDAVNMVPTIALEEYGMMVLRVKTLYRAIFENRLVAAFLRGTPGIEAWSMLGKAYFEAFGLNDTPSDKYDLVIVDAPATGHALDMLRVPKVILDVAPIGLLRREAERALTLFRDPQQSSFVLVSLPEDMPANETIELHRALTTELGLPASGLAVNRMVPELFEPHERTKLTSDAAQLAAESNSWVHAGAERSARELVQIEEVATLSQQTGLPQVHFPELYTRQLNRAHVERLSRLLVLP